MVKVGIVMLFGNDWLGGINYFNNLFNAVKGLPDNHIDFTIFTGYAIDDSKFRAFPSIRVIKNKIFDRFTLPWLCRKFLQKILRYDWMLERLLKKHDIRVLSHSGVIGPDASLPTISWIPDFQHMHLPGFFSAQEIARRDANFSDYANWSTVLLLSSHDALKDLERFSQARRPATKVLKFAVNPEILTGQTTDLADLQERYSFSSRYFLLPNQFWAHKNHRVVIDALAILKAKGKRVMVLATGSTEDNRNPGFFLELQGHIKDRGIEDQFRILGIVPLSDLYGLMTHADAVINPSLFEGWSTTVEEAKTLNKCVLLSDIGVHREQAPARGAYFNPGDAEALARLMDEVAGAEASDDRADYARAMQRFQDYGCAYHELVMELTGNG